MTQNAWFGNPELKAKIVSRAKEHEGLGSIQQKTYGEWEVIQPGTAQFKGCAVGCLVQPTQYIVLTDGWQDDDEFIAWLREQRDEGNNIPSGATEDADNYETYKQLIEQFNFSENLCFLIEAIFETLPNDQAQYWPAKIVEAIPVNADVSDSVINNIVNDNKEIFGPVIDVANDITGHEYFEEYNGYIWDYECENEEVLEADPVTAGQILISSLNN